MDDDTVNAVDRAARELTATIGLGDEFLRGLEKDDDWSFIVKTHALIESAMSHALSEALGKKELIEVLSELPLSDTRIGKVAFSKVLLRLQPEDRTFIKKFSELRNDLVHDVKNVGFSIGSHFDGLDVNGKRAFVRQFAYTYIDDGVKDAALDAMAIRMRPRLRGYIFNTILALLAFLQLGIDIEKSGRTIAENERKIGQFLTTLKKAGRSADMQSGS